MWLPKKNEKPVQNINYYQNIQSNQQLTCVAYSATENTTYVFMCY